MQQNLVAEWIGYTMCADNNGNALEVLIILLRRCYIFANRQEIPPSSSESPLDGDGGGDRSFPLLWMDGGLKPAGFLCILKISHLSLRRAGKKWSFDGVTASVPPSHHLAVTSLL